MNGPKPNRPAGIGRTTNRGHCRWAVRQATSPHLSPWGARRLRRFGVGQTMRHCGKPACEGLRTVKRPEGRAPPLIFVGALNTYREEDEPFSPRSTIQSFSLSLRGARCSLSLRELRERVRRTVPTRSGMRGNCAKCPPAHRSIPGTVELDASSGEAGGFRE